MKCVGITCLGLILIAIATGVVVYLNAETWSRQGAAWVGRMGAEAIIDEFNLPADEKQKVMVPIEQLFAGVEDGTVTLEQMGIALGEIASGGTMGALAARAFEVNYVETSGLTEEEKQQARMTLSRFVQGAIEQKISQEQVQAIVDQVSATTTDAEGNVKQTLKDSLADEELKTALEQMKQAADDAGIAEEKFAFDLAELVQQAVDRALQATPGGDAPAPVEPGEAGQDGTDEAAPTPAPRARPRPGAPEADTAPTGTTP